MSNLEFKDFDEYLKESLKDKEIKEQYDELNIKYKLIEKTLEFRNKNHMTQTDLANIMGVKQQNISRFEKGLVEPTTKFIAKLLNAIHVKIKLEEVIV